MALKSFSPIPKQKKRILLRQRFFCLVGIANLSDSDELFNALAASLGTPTVSPPQP